MNGRLLLSGGLAVAAHAGLAGSAPWQGEAGLFRALLLCAVAAALLPVAGRGGAPGAATAAGERPVRGALLWILGVSAALHALWLPVPPTLSNDVYRYAFEGRLVRSGISPYAVAPADSTLAPFHDGVVFPRVGHPELSTVYPPLSLAAFAAADAFGGVPGQKLLFATASMVSVALLALWLTRRRAAVEWAALYGWSPLLPIEFAGGAHHDALGLALLAAALLLIETSRWRGSALAWGAAVATKGAALVTLPAFWPAWPAPGRWLAVVAAAAGLVPLLWLSAGEHSGWSAYARHWHHNGLAFAVLSSVLGVGTAVRLALGALLLLGLALLLRAPSPLATKALRASGLALFLSPTFHPWYAGWVLLWAVAARSWAGWTLAQISLFTYALPGAVTPGFAEVPIGPRLLLWAIPAGVWIAERAWRRRAHSPGGAS